MNAAENNSILKEDNHNLHNYAEIPDPKIDFFAIRFHK